MTFSREFKTLIKKSDNTYVEYSFDKGILLRFLNSNYNTTFTKIIMRGNYSFLDTYFDVDENDNIFGLISQDESLLYIKFKDKFFITDPILKFNSSQYSIKFPYIKKQKSMDHIIYYEIAPTSALKNGKLIHYYKFNNKWEKNIISNIEYNILSNYAVITCEESIKVFYLSIVNGYEEIFLSSFDLTLKEWSNPLQLTSTQKQKVYLSVVRSSKNIFNIVFSENYTNNYYCINLNLFIDKNKCSSINYTIIRKTLTCSFPNIVFHDDALFAQWIEYGHLYTCYSEDNGDSWSRPVFDNQGYNKPFIRYDYRSYLNESNRISTLFSLEEYVNVLGFNKII